MNLTARRAADILARYAECAPQLQPETWDPQVHDYRRLTPGEISKGQRLLRREQLRAAQRLLSRPTRFA